MRKKGPIWEERYQRLIVDSYAGGMFISDIMKLPEIAGLAPSEYTVRNILRANGVKANWRKKKRKPGFWDQENVERIVAMRNDGMSIRAIRDAVNSEIKRGRISKSTIVRILDEKAEQVDFHPPRTQDIWKPKIVQAIVKMYESGMLISEIQRCELLRDYKPSSYVIRDVLKSQGVKLTWKKGELRRWPQEVQKRIVDMYRSGMRFAEIISHPELAQFRPTNYAIRKILKKNGVKTKGETRYKQPISTRRFKQYREDELSQREEAIIHKHLAVNPAGRQLMQERMGLTLADEVTAKGTAAERVRKLQRTAKRWAGFFSWGICNLSDEATKHKIISLGLKLGERIRLLSAAYSNGDEAKRKQIWSEISEVSEAMSTLYAEILGKPARSFKISSLQ